MAEKQKKDNIAVDASHTQVSVTQDEHILQAGLYHGPIPLPSVMKGYKDINPKYPDMIMDEFIANSKHIRESEERAQKAEITRDQRGQAMAFILSILLLGIVGFSLSLGNMTFAGVGGLVFVVWIIKTFNVKVSKKSSLPTESLPKKK